MAKPKYSKEELEKMMQEVEEQEKEEQEKEEQNDLKHSKKKKLADYLVPFVVITNIIFGIAILVIFYKTGLEPSTLIERWFKFFGYELLAMAGIQIANVVGEHFGGDR